MSRPVSAETVETYLEILPMIEALADRGEPMPAWSDRDSSPEVRSKRALKYLAENGHIKVLYSGTYGLQVEVVRSKKRTAGIKVLRVRTVMRKRATLADREKPFASATIPPPLHGDYGVMADAERLASLGVWFGGPKPGASK